MCIKYMIKKFKKIHPMILAVISTRMWDYKTVLFSPFGLSVSKCSTVEVYCSCSIIRLKEH